MTTRMQRPAPPAPALLALWLVCWLHPAFGGSPANTRFTLREPAAAAVFLAGEFNGWNTLATPLHPHGTGGWSVEIPLSPGRHAYKFIVDGRWQDDPAATEFTDDGLGGRNSVRVVAVAVAAEPAAVLPPPPSPPPTVGRWTTDAGQAFTGEFLRLGNGGDAVFLLNGRDFPYPLARLVPADQGRIREILQARQPASPGTFAGKPLAAQPEATAAVSSSFVGQSLLPGKPVLVSIPLGTESGILRPIREAYGRASSTAKMFLAVPAGFAPERRPYPVLIVSSTTDGEATSVGAAGGYVPTASDKGFVVMAVDGEFAKPADPQRDVTDFRWALVQAGLQALTREWPTARTWPVATAGVSGGGGYASHQAILVAAERRERPLLGMFLAVSGWNPTSFPAELRRAPFGPFRQVPVFMSAGEKDTIATLAITEGSRAEMQRDGFRKLRCERFPGGHQLWGEHLRGALDWFLENGRKMSPPVLPAAESAK